MIDFSVTIIITTYNRDHYLKDCLNSILKQSYKNYKIIIVSDGYFESTKSLINSYNNEKIELFSNIHTGIPSVSRNIGIIKSNSDLICFCDDDDIWNEEKLMDQVAIFKLKQNCLVYTNAYYISSDGMKIIIKKNLLLNKYNNLLRQSNNFLFFKNYICLSSIMITSNLAKINLFNESIEYRGSEDYLFLLNILKLKQPIYHINKNHVGYRLHNSNISSDILSGYKRSIKILNLKLNDYNFIKYIIILVAIFFYYIKYIMKYIQIKVFK